MRSVDDVSVEAESNRHVPRWIFLNYCNAQRIAAGSESSQRESSGQLSLSEKLYHLSVQCHVGNNPYCRWGSLTAVSHLQKL